MFRVGCAEREYSFHLGDEGLRTRVGAGSPEGQVGDQLQGWDSLPGLPGARASVLLTKTQASL